jgi:hypothetical protein
MLQPASENVLASREDVMPLTLAQMISIPGSAESSFDHGAFEPRTRRVFVAHTGRNRVEVLASETMSHVATLPGFPHAAGVVADDGHVLAQYGR